MGWYISLTPPLLPTLPCAHVLAMHALPCVFVLFFSVSRQVSFASLVHMDCKQTLVAYMLYI